MCLSICVNVFVIVSSHMPKGCLYLLFNQLGISGLTAEREEEVEHNDLAALRSTVCGENFALKAIPGGLGIQGGVPSRHCVQKCLAARWLRLCWSRPSCSRASPASLRLAASCSQTGPMAAGSSCRSPANSFWRLGLRFS